MFSKVLVLFLGVAAAEPSCGVTCTLNADDVISVRHDVRDDTTTAHRCFITESGGCKCLCDEDWSTATSTPTTFSGSLPPHHPGRSCASVGKTVGAKWGEDAAAGMCKEKRYSFTRLDSWNNGKTKKCSDGVKVDTTTKDTSQECRSWCENKWEDAKKEGGDTEARFCCQHNYGGSDKCILRKSVTGNPVTLKDSNNDNIRSIEIDSEHVEAVEVDGTWEPGHWVDDCASEGKTVGAKWGEDPLAFGACKEKRYSFTRLDSWNNGKTKKCIDGVKVDTTTKDTSGKCRSWCENKWEDAKKEGGDTEAKFCCQHNYGGSDKCILRKSVTGNPVTLKDSNNGNIRSIEIDSEHVEAVEVDGTWEPGHWVE